MKVAIMGAWHVHAVGYAQLAMELGEVIGFYERDATLAAEFAKYISVPRFNTPEELLNSEAEGVIVCSASADHTEDIIQIANAGKHIFTEKVLALTNGDCDRIEQAVKQNGVRFVISFVQKYQASRIAVKQVAASGELGKLNYMRFRNCHSGSTKNWLPAHFYSAEQCGGGAMIDLGAHGMYLTEWLFGMPIKASSAFTVSCSSVAAKEKNKDGIEDNAVTVMQFANGAIAVNETGFVSNCSPVILEVHGEDGYVRMVDNRVYKCTEATGGKEVELAVGEDAPSPLAQFLTGNILDGCGMEQAKALTHMMTLAYAK